jgi:Uma2 family endonuclease
MTLVPLPGVYKLTSRDWLGFPDDGKLYELIDGELFVTPAPSTRHQRLARNLARHLDAHLVETGRGELFFAPIGVKLSDEDVVEPDLVVVLAEHAERIGPQVIEGAPDLVVEILSPGSAGRDLTSKRDLYARFGIPEYWIVDPESASVEVLTIEGDAYARSGLFRRGDTLRSDLLEGLELALSEIFPAE